MTIDANTALGILGFLAQLVGGVIWISRLGARVEHLEAQVDACRKGWESADHEQQDRMDRGADRFAAVEDSLHKIAISQAITAEQLKALGESVHRVDRSLTALHGQISGKVPKNPSQSHLELHG